MYKPQRDLEGVAYFVIIMAVLALFGAVIGFTLVQDSNHQTECVKAGYSYVDGNCLARDTTILDD
jgi:hypothetical protein